MPAHPGTPPTAPARPQGGRLAVAALAVGAAALLGPLAGTASAAPSDPGPTATVPAGATGGTPLLPAGQAPRDPLTGATTAPSATAPAAAAVNRADAGASSWSWPAILGAVVLAAVSVLLAAVAFTTLAWMLHAWTTPDRLRATRFSGVRPSRERLRFSLLVPARHEEAVLGDTLDKLAAVDYDDVEIIAIVGHDDPGTEAVAREAALRHPGRVRVVVDASVPKNKPKALNTALPHCTGDVVGVMDAEDEVHPDLLTNIAGRFEETGADVVQGGVQLMNFQSNWWALRNVLEYYFWFRSRLHFHAGARFIPLGGNTVFLRTEQLRAVGGWDPECLAEDCEIGVRLSSRGARVAVAYDPELVTREETPGDLRSLVKQRTRWSQGFLQVLRKGVWRELPTRRQRLLARYTLAMPFLQAFTGVMIPVAVVLVLVAKVPAWLTLVTFLPLVPTLVTLAVEAAGLHEFGRAYSQRVRVRDYLALLLGTFPYQLLLSVAAVRAVVREARGQNGWEKTAHAGLHRPASVDLRDAAASVAAVVDEPAREVVLATGAREAVR